MIDPHIRSYRDRPPLYFGPDMIPGRRVGGEVVRFRWPDPAESDVAYLRREMQDGGPGLFILGHPFIEDVKVIVEAQYPEKIRPGYFDLVLDPIRKAEAREGALVIISNALGEGAEEPLQYVGVLDRRIVGPLRAHNRRGRLDLRRRTNVGWYEKELEGLRQAEDEAELDPIARKFARGDREIRRYLRTKVSVPRAVGGD